MATFCPSIVVLPAWYCVYDCAAARGTARSIVCPARDDKIYKKTFASVTFPACTDNYQDGWCHRYLLRICFFLSVCMFWRFWGLSIENDGYLLLACPPISTGFPHIF
jgi:hypothetical protein